VNKLILCTVGTSIANSCPEQRELIRRKTNWTDDYSALSKQLDDFVSKTSNPRKISAEMNTLDRIGIDAGDRIVLLSSDNAPGRACSEALKQVIMEHFGLASGAVDLKRIEGLQVRDAKLLREQGLKNFVKVVLSYLNDPQYQYSYETIINPTGGFKGILPFLTILGMLYGKRTIYIFEFSDELINLPPLPFSFDLQLYNRVRPALHFIDREVAVSEQAFLNHVTDFTAPERDLFMAFTEPFDAGMITLSPLAYCLLSIEMEHEHCLVTPQVDEHVRNEKGVSGIVLKRLIGNAENPLWRNSHIHRWDTTDLLIMKQSRTAERIAGFVKNDRFHVTHAFSNHDEYERTLGKFSKSDFDTAEFINWEPDENVGVDEDNRDALAEERDDLLVEKNRLGKNVEQLMSDIKEQKNQSSRTVSDLEKKIRRLEMETEELKKELEAQALKENPSIFKSIISFFDWRVK